MTLETLLNAAKAMREDIHFNEVITTIDNAYTYTPRQFTNGDLTNQAGTNEGSCKVFAFAKLHQLTENQTLCLFGQYYFNDVKKHPDGNDHQNIRQFIKTGWEGIEFSQPPLTKTTEYFKD